MAESFNRIRFERKKRAWSQRMLADMVGTTTISINRWENGKTVPQPYYRQQLCIIFRVSPEELFPPLQDKRVSSISPHVPLKPSKLREMRLQYGFTQELVAEKVETNRVTVTRWEQGHTLPNFYHMQRLCELFAMPPEELFPDNGSIQKEEIATMPVSLVDLEQPKVCVVPEDVTDSLDTTAMSMGKVIRSPLQWLTSIRAAMVSSLKGSFEKSSENKK